MNLRISPSVNTSNINSNVPNTVSITFTKDMVKAMYIIVNENADNILKHCKNSQYEKCIQSLYKKDTALFYKIWEKLFAATQDLNLPSDWKHSEI